MRNLLFILMITCMSARAQSQSEIHKNLLMLCEKLDQSVPFEKLYREEHGKEVCLSGVSESDSARIAIHVSVHETDTGKMYHKYISIMSKPQQQWLVVYNTKKMTVSFSEKVRKKNAYKQIVRMLESTNPEQCIFTKSPIHSHSSFVSETTSK